MEKEYDKALARHDELLKQDVTLRKEYTTLLRKISSLHSVLEGGFSESSDKNGDDDVKVLSEESISKLHDLKWYNDQLKLIKDGALTENGDFIIPEELLDSYKLYKETPLLYNDTNV